MKYSPVQITLDTHFHALTFPALLDRSAGAMADITSAVAVIRAAIYQRRQLLFTAANRPREICPHVLGTTRGGVWRVLGWQFGGDSRDGPLPDWRCIELKDITSEIVARDGLWHRGWRPRGGRQTCVDFIYAEVDPPHGAELRSTSPLRIRAPALSLWVQKKQ
jgi:hypothetical protein